MTDNKALPNEDLIRLRRVRKMINIILGIVAAMASVTLYFLFK